MGKLVLCDKVTGTTFKVQLETTEQHPGIHERVETAHAHYPLLDDLPIVQAD